MSKRTVKHELSKADDSDEPMESNDDQVSSSTLGHKKPKLDSDSDKNSSPMNLSDQSQKSTESEVISYATTSSSQSELSEFLADTVKFAQETMNLIKIYALTPTADNIVTEIINMCDPLYKSAPPINKPYSEQLESEEYPPFVIPDPDSIEFNDAFDKNNKEVMNILNKIHLNESIIITSMSLTYLYNCMIHFGCKINAQCKVFIITSLDNMEEIKNEKKYITQIATIFINSDDTNFINTSVRYLYNEYKYSYCIVNSSLYNPFLKMIHRLYPSNSLLLPIDGLPNCNKEEYKTNVEDILFVGLNTDCLIKSTKEMSDEIKLFLNTLIEIDNPEPMIRQVLRQNNLLIFSKNVDFYIPNINMAKKIDVLYYLYKIGVINVDNQFTNKYAKNVLKYALKSKLYGKINYNIFNTEMALAYAYIDAIYITEFECFEKLRKCMIHHLKAVGFNNEEIRAFNESTVVNIISYSLHYIKNGSNTEFSIQNEEDKSRRYVDIRFYDPSQNVKLLVEVKINKPLQKTYDQCTCNYYEECSKLICLGIAVNKAESEIDISMSVQVYEKGKVSETFMINESGCYFSMK